MRLLRTLLPQIHTTLKAHQLKVSIICLKFHHVYIICHSKKKRKIYHLFIISSLQNEDES